MGVWSRRQAKCEKLQQVIHCRNCEVYTNAGRKAIEKAVPIEYIAQWTKDYSQVAAAEAKKQCSVVVFRLGVEWFCLPTQYCKSIENRSVIHSIPRYSNQLLLGIVNIKGTLQLCFSLDSLLQVATEDVKHPNNSGIYKRLLVLLYDQQHYVFPVDEVGGIDRIDDANLESPPATLSQRQAEFVKGMVKTEKQKVALLNTGPLFMALEELVGG